MIVKLKNCGYICNKLSGLPSDKHFKCSHLTRLCDKYDPNIMCLLTEQFGKKSLTFSFLEKIHRSIDQAHMRLRTEILNNAEKFPSTPNGFLKLIVKWHRQLFFETKIEKLGRFRTLGESVVIDRGANEFEGAHPNEIKRKLERLFSFAIAKGFDLPEPKFVSVCAYFLVNFFNIHPFNDGNGRIGRLILVFFAHQTNRYQFKSFTDSAKERKKYVDALRFAHKRIARTDDQYRNVTNPYCKVESWLSKHIIFTNKNLEDLPP